MIIRIRLLILYLTQDHWHAIKNGSESDRKNADQNQIEKNRILNFDIYNGLWYTVWGKMHLHILKKFFVLKVGVEKMSAPLYTPFLSKRSVKSARNLDSWGFANLH